MAIKCKCGGTIFESVNSMVNFAVKGGEATFTTDGFLCTKCGQTNVEFKVSVKTIPEVKKNLQ